MSPTAMATIAYALLLVVLLVARRRLGTFVSVTAFTVATLAYMQAGIDPPIPWSAMRIFLAVFLAAMLVYITSSRQMADEFWAPIRRTIVDNRRLPILVVILLVIPGVVAVKAYRSGLPSSVPPPKNRTVHPAPPSTITFTAPGATESSTIDVIAGNNPLRALPADQLAAKIVHGRKVFYENCFYCHGDTLAADGHFVDAVKPPIPATFRDPAVLPMLTESFFFWRIAKGGPGLPEEATPFDSTMPQWEKFLTEDDIWSSLLFLYDYAGYVPRANEPAHGAAGAPPAHGAK